MQHAPSERDDRSSLLALMAALDVSPRTLRRDPCGDWSISGKLGHVYADGTGFLLYVSTDESPRRWSNVKQRLQFCRVTQDGDDEGALWLDHLPAPAEEALGIRKRRHLSAETLMTARSALERARA